MKLLLDTCIWGGAVEALKAAGHDVLWAGAWDVDPGDDDSLAQAHQEVSICLAVLARYGTELQTGSIVNADPGRVRVRPPNTAPESP